MWYLTSVKHYPLYGSVFYHVTYKGFWSHPNTLILAVDVAGMKFVNVKTKQVNSIIIVASHLLHLLAPLALDHGPVHLLPTGERGC